jgi:hypothetical protein
VLDRRRARLEASAQQRTAISIEPIARGNKSDRGGHAVVLFKCPQFG